VHQHINGFTPPSRNIKKYLSENSSCQGSFGSRLSKTTRRAKRHPYLAFIDQEVGGSYSPARLVHRDPKKNKQRYQIFQSPYTGQVHISSYRRNWTHRCIAIFKKKRKGGPTIDNIDSNLGSFLELDGSIHDIKTSEDVYSRCREKSLPTPSYVTGTSLGHFHVIWLYECPLPWTPKNARWWIAQQHRLIEIFQDFGPDGKACLNPVQFLRNWSQLKPFNYKRKCDVIIHSTKYKTNLGALQRALDRTGVENPRIPAETIIRQDLRQKKHITQTQKEWGKRIGLSERTMNRIIPKLIHNGDLRIAARYGNNKAETRINKYESLIYLEPHCDSKINQKYSQEITFSELPIERSIASLPANERLLREFCGNGAVEGLRNKAIITCGLYVKWKKSGEISFDELYNVLYPGFVKCGISEKEYIRTLRNALKAKYTHPLSRKTLENWGLLENQNCKIAGDC